MIGTSPLHVQVIDGLLLSNQHGMDLGLYFLPILGLGPFYCQIIKRVGRFHFNQKGLVQNLEQVGDIFSTNALCPGQKSVLWAESRAEY